MKTPVSWQCSNSSKRKHRETQSSLIETIRARVMNGMSYRADRVKSDFKVPDKRFSHIKLRALIAMRDFDALETFARSKRSPIGYEVFVRQLVVVSKLVTQRSSDVRREMRCAKTSGVVCVV
ncbi:Vps16, C-terminal region-domain-containing protein [Pisolithus albus]|nr:Vps16, C-terminal region-domain-containing protein [Pisolithus albus]